MRRLLKQDRKLRSRFEPWDILNSCMMKDRDRYVKNKGQPWAKLFQLSGEGGLMFLIRQRLLVPAAF